MIQERSNFPIPFEPYILQRTKITPTRAGTSKAAII